jgi:hypothetical protein
MFLENSRYANITTYTLTDSRGRTVNVVAVPPAPLQNLLGYHLLKKGQRPDHLANKYLDDPTAYWRIAEINDVTLAEAITEKPEIAIPQKTS